MDRTPVSHEVSSAASYQRLVQRQCPASVEPVDFHYHVKSLNELARGSTDITFSIVSNMTLRGLLIGLNFTGEEFALELLSERLPIAVAILVQQYLGVDATKGWAIPVEDPIHPDHGCWLQFGL